MPFLLMFIVALVCSSIGFKKYVWFISIGYGLAIAAIGVTEIIHFQTVLTTGTLIASILLIVYGLRLGGYLTIREWKSSTYNAKMKTEIKSGKGMKIGVKCAIWVTAALLYAAETAPVTFRLENRSPDDILLWIGIAVSVIGLIIETAADIQKNTAKKRNPGRFVDTGLYRLVRCPNYFGEMLMWTGVFVGGLSVCKNAWQWIAVILGYAGIIYVMFSGARRLEIRQNKTYGGDPEYRRYVAKTPIMIPLVPIYSVERHKWLVG